MLAVTSLWAVQHGAVSVQKWHQTLRGGRSRYGVVNHREALGVATARNRESGEGCTEASSFSHERVPYERVKGLERRSNSVRVLVCGGRDCNDWSILCCALHGRSFGGRDRFCAVID